MNDSVSMWQKGRRRIAEACLSDLVLDRLFLGEGPAETREQKAKQAGKEEHALAQAHLATCRACSDAFAALAEDRQRFTEQADVPALARDALARAASLRPGGVGARLQRWLAPVLGLALAAGGLLLWARGDRGGAADDLRSKGGVGVGLGVELFVKHAETAGEGKLHLGEALHPGDRVRLRLAGDSSAYVAVLAVDTTGRVSVYHPAGGAVATALPPGHRPLPGAVELDGTLGTEVIVAFSCPTPVAVDTLVRAVQQATDRARVASDPAEAVGPLQAPCVSARYRIEKVPAGGAR